VDNDTPRPILETPDDSDERVLPPNWLIAPFFCSDLSVREFQAGYMISGAPPCS
jgi:hypothetical protein